MRSRSLYWQVLIALTLVAALQGCATTDRRVDILYQPVAKAKGGSGALYLVQGVRSAAKQAASIQWVLGTVKNSDGQKVGNVVTDIVPANLVIDALNQELQDAGYQVILTDTMPADAKKGLRLDDVVLKLDQTQSVLKDDANCSVRMALQPLRNGKALGSSSYEAEYSDTAVTDRDQLASKVLQKALQLVMTRSVPEIVNTIEQK